MRILLSSNAPWSNTGYGAQVMSLLPRLAALDCVGGPQNIACFAWYGLQGAKLEWGPYRIYPMGGEPYGNDLIGFHAKDFGADVVITLIDVWTQKQTARKVAPAAWLPWFPVDSDPAPQDVLDSLAGAHTPVAYSLFGQSMLAKAGVLNSAYVPHGVEVEVFKPEPDAAKRAYYRKLLVGPGCEHLTVMVAANKGGWDRKAFQVNFAAWAEFARDKPTARLYCHTMATVDAGGLDLGALAQACGIADKVVFPEPYAYYMGAPSAFVAACYQAADVLLGASMAEGFGIPIIEAQACGIPVVVTDYSSMPELVRWGYSAPVAHKVWNFLNSWWAWPAQAGVTEALEELYDEQRADPAWYAERGEQASALIHQEYGWDVVVEEYWRPVLEQISPQRAQSTQRPEAEEAKAGAEVLA